MLKLYKINISLFEKTKSLEFDQQDTTSKIFELLKAAEEENFQNAENKNFKFFVPALNRFVNIDETKLGDILGNIESWSFELQEDQSQKKQTIIQEFQLACLQTQIYQEILSKPSEQQIYALNQELKKLDYNKNLTHNQKQYLKHYYQQQLIPILKEQGEVKSILHVPQNIDISNPELLLFVLKEQLLRDQNRELLVTSKEYSFGFDSIMGAYGSDQSCLKVRNTNLDYDKIVNDNQLLQHHLLEFKQKLSSSLNISITQIEILGVSKGSFEISFNITGNDMDSIQQQINNNSKAKQFLNEYCNGKVEYLRYFDQASNQAKGVTISSDDLHPQYNMSWNSFHEKEQRGPPYHRYDYYFPRGCYGFGLNVQKYVKDHGNDWLKMDGNPNEWRIMYHGTQNYAVNPIIANNLQPGQVNCYANENCLDEFGKTVKVGVGIYFSDNINISLGYANYVDVGDKQFAAAFMTRVNPKKIRQCNKMKKINYFVVNNSEDVRPYRLLLHEKKTMKYILNTCALY